jgi:leucyl-tRNA synthetase
MISTIVLTLHDPDSPATSLRCDALGSLLCRLRTLDGQRAEFVVAPVEPISVMTDLSATTTVLVADDNVYYVPTRAARDQVAGEEDGTWPLSLMARQRKVIRHSAGAIFRFPLEGEGDGDEALEAFVTDWTGMPGVCAMAIHPAHPLSKGISPGAQAEFTGRFCRHPLSGDLLPIWAAEWVKAEFGTGAVAVNPGHNRVDLEFCRQAGLPVRFALVPREYDGSPETWVTPPYIKSGVAIRSGIADGQPYDQARNAYFGTLAERGLAELYTDSGMGKFAIAQVDQAGAAEVRWDPARRTLAQSGGRPGEALRLSVSPVLAAADERVRAAEILVIAPSSRVESDLLALRLLLAEPDVKPVVKAAPDVLVVGKTLPVDVTADDEVLHLAMLVNAGLLDTVALKPQYIEPCERFRRVHEDLVRAEPAAGAPGAAGFAKSAARVKGLLTSWDFKQAFTHLYRLQKTLAKTDNPAEQDLASYFALAYGLAGLDAPDAAENLAATWQQI